MSPPEAVLAVVDNKSVGNKSSRLMPVLLGSIVGWIVGFLKTSSFDVSEEKVNKNLEYFLKVLKKEGLYE